MWNKSFQNNCGGGVAASGLVGAFDLVPTEVGNFAVDYR